MDAQDDHNEGSRGPLYGGGRSVQRKEQEENILDVKSDDVATGDNPGTCAGQCRGRLLARRPTKRSTISITTKDETSKFNDLVVVSR